jgi:hypothetical protein
VTGLSTEEKAIVDTVADWVDREVRPVVRDLEHANAYTLSGTTATLR